MPTNGMSQLEWIVEAILRRFEPSTTTITGIGFLVDAYGMRQKARKNNIPLQDLMRARNSVVQYQPRKQRAGEGVPRPSG
jgi:hypothetical protein